MRSRRLSLIVTLLLLALLIGGLGWTIYAPIRQERLNRTLIAAIEKGDAAEVKVLLDKGADVNAQQIPGKAGISLRDLWRLFWRRGTTQSEIGSPTCLRLAVNRGNLDIVKALLAKGAFPDVKDRTGATVLMRVIYQDKPELARLLIEHGANVNAVNEDGETPLMFSAVFHDLQTSQMLIDHRANVQASTGEGYTALWFAAAGTSFPLHMSVKQGWGEKEQADADQKAASILKLLLDAGAKVNGKDKRGHGLMEWVLDSGLVQVPTILIARGADVNAVIPYSQANTIGCGLVIEGIHMRIGHTLRTRPGETLLMHAASTGDVDLVRALLSHGANVGIKDNHGATAIHYASGNEEIIKLLKQAGARE